VSLAHHHASGPDLALNAEGPPLRHTGGFGEPTCQECHSEYPLNDAGGAVAIDGLPEHYEPGRTYTIDVVLSSEDMGRAGFEAAVRFLDGPNKGNEAGRLAAVDGRVMATRDSVTGVTYVHHSTAGSMIGQNTEQTSWTFKWAAPNGSVASRDVVLHVAANSANGDNSPLGDLIYTAEARSGRVDQRR
jgi:hypothetical protein